MIKETEKISYFIEEVEDEDNSSNYLNIEQLLNDIENVNIYHENHYNLLKHDKSISEFLDYNENYTIKDLMLICDYYGFVKEIKQNKFNKEQIIQSIIIFESNPENILIVNKRRNMWFYINELKNDKFMKKYLLWK